jgi:hypothetical protein
MNDEFFLGFAKREIKNFLRFSEVGLLDYSELEFARNGSFDCSSIKLGVALCSVCITLGVRSR